MRDIVYLVLYIETRIDLIHRSIVVLSREGEQLTFSAGEVRGVMSELGARTLLFPSLVQNPLPAVIKNTRLSSTSPRSFTTCTPQKKSIAFPCIAHAFAQKSKNTTFDKKTSPLTRKRALQVDEPVNFSSRNVNSRFFDS